MKSLENTTDTSEDLLWLAKHLGGGGGKKMLQAQIPLLPPGTFNSHHMPMIRSMPKNKYMQPEIAVYFMLNQIY